MTDGEQTGGTSRGDTGTTPSGGVGSAAGDRVGAQRARSIRVFAPADRGRRHALRWAARHAARTGGCIQVLVDPGERQQQEHPAGTVGLLGRTLRDLLARVVDPLRSPDAGSVTRDLVGAVAGARLLVIPQSLPELLAVVEAVTEPVVAVPDHPLPPGDASVVLALAPWTGPEVIGAAFETAAQYGVALRVMQALDPERETGEAARTCRDDLAAWRLVRPQVTVDVEVVDRDPVEALHRRARGAQLLVMGRPARGRVRELVAPSPTSELLRTAACPVLVVPPPGPSRPTWSSHPGWGATH